jgi:predicted 3-demethylubiquinone-9 3-methyltransferase (glyoxalase superfamily)
MNVSEFGPEILMSKQIPDQAKKFFISCFSDNEVIYYHRITKDQIGKQGNINNTGKMNEHKKTVRQYQS